MTRSINLTPKQLRILEVIRDWRRRHGYSPTMQEIADEVGVTKVTVFEHVESLLRKGAVRRDPHKARSLAVVDDSVLPTREQPPSISFPLVGRIAAGYPIERFPQSDELSVSELYAPRLGSTNPTFLLEADGNSMRGDGVLDGDYVVLEQREAAAAGERVVATIANGETIMARYYPQPDGTIRLDCASADGGNGPEPMVVTSCRIHGIVRGVLRRYA